MLLCPGSSDVEEKKGKVGEICRKGSNAYRTSNEYVLKVHACPGAELHSQGLEIKAKAVQTYCGFGTGP